MDINSVDIKDLRMRHYPDPVLRGKAQRVESFDPALAAIADRMVDIMLQEDGVGLAAPQVGLPIQLVVISLTGKREDVEVFVNPVLSNFQGSCEIEEGCLSVPGVRSTVKRAGVCTVEAQDLDGNGFTMDATEFAAVAVQHETDHLNGILFIDRLSTLGRIACRRGLKLLEQEYKK